MPKYEHVNIQGIPFLVDESRVVYTYEPLAGGSPPISIGSISSSDNTLQLHTNWREVTEERIMSWRTHLVPTERGKIRELYKPPKQSRNRKSDGKYANKS
jgi:hypothetical protein